MARSACQHPSRCPFVLGDKDASFPQIQGGHLSDEGFITCFMGDGKRESHSDLPAAVFSNSFSLKYSTCQMPYFGALCPEPRYYPCEDLRKGIPGSGGTGAKTPQQENVRVS